MVARVGLFLPNLAGGGAERVFLELARGLLARSIAVDLILVAAVGPLMTDIPPGANVVDLQSSRTARSLPALRRYLRDNPPDVLLSAITHTNAIAVVAARTVLPRVPVVVTAHNTMSSKVAHAVGRLEKLTPLVARLVYPHADRIVAVSVGVADDLATSTGIPRHRIDVAYNPVVSDRLMTDAGRPTGHPWLTDRAGPVIVAIGRLTEQKDFPTLLHAVALLPPDYRLIILGDGDLRPSLESLAQELGIAGRVDLAGFVDNPYPFLREADVFVLSSLWEGLPTVLIEALPFDIAVVSTDCTSGPREILDNGRWGALVPPGDPRQMAEEIITASAHPRKRPPEAWAPYELGAATQRYVEILTDSHAHQRR